VALEFSALAEQRRKDQNIDRWELGIGFTVEAERIEPPLAGKWTWAGKLVAFYRLTDTKTDIAPPKPIGELWATSANDALDLAIDATNTWLKDHHQELPGAAESGQR
jgi:hypothetical protein